MRRWLYRPVGRSALSSLGIQGQRVLVQLLTAVFLARLLGPAGFGTYSFAWAVILFAQVFPTGGLGTALLRFASLYRATESWPKLKGLCRFGIGTALAYGVLSAAAVTGVATIFQRTLNDLLSPRILWAMTVPLLVLPLVGAFGALLRGLNRRLIGQLPEFVVRPAVFLALVAIAFCVNVGGPISPAMALGLQGIAAVFATVLGVAWLRRTMATNLDKQAAVFESSRWIGSAAPAALAGGLVLLSTQADIVMLGVLSTAKVTGEYRVASQGANLLAVVLTAANLLIAPRIAALYAIGDRAGVQRLLSVSVKAAFTAALFMATTFWIAGPWLLLAIFGKHYTDAYEPLAILCVGQLINVGCGSVGTALTMTGNEKVTMQIAAVSAAINVLLNVILIPRYAGIGAAVATAASFLVWNSAMAVTLWRRTGLAAPLLFYRRREK